MIRITAMSNLRKIGTDQFDEIWAIVRSMKSKSDIMTQVTELSPSFDLFMKYRNMAQNNNWNKNTFESVYVPQFITEMLSEEAREKLNYLYSADKENKNICLVCFCPDETLCHRSIIAGLLQGTGVNVTTDSGNDYTKYYDKYLKVKKG